jgi:nucleoside-diphosphate-sugar epimerase
VRVLVTGGAGYIGSTLVPLLLAAGHGVTVLDRSGPDAAGQGEEPELRRIAGDVRDRAAREAALEGTDLVVHLAAISGHPACEREPEEAWSVNVEGTRGLCRSAGRTPVVLASTGSVYGAVPGGLCTELTPPSPLSRYGRSKLEAEWIVLESPSGIVLRFATCYGLSPRMRLDLLVNQFVDVLVREGRIDVYEPEARRTFLHVFDAARAILLVAGAADRAAGRVWNVGDEAGNQTKREVLELIRAEIPGALVRYGAAGHDPDRRDYAVSYAAIRALGFTASVPLSQGVRELVAELSRRKPRA